MNNDLLSYRERKERVGETERKRTFSAFRCRTLSGTWNVVEVLGNLVLEKASPLEALRC